jgi:uncharacterized protein (TIGR02145 family)
MATKRNIIIDVKRIILNKVRLSGISLIIMACFSTMSFGENDSKKMNIPDTTSNEVLFGFVNEYINAMNLFAKNNYPAKEQLNIAGDFFLQKGEGNVVLDFPGIKPSENFLIGSYLTQMKIESIILKYKENLTIQRCLHNGLLNEGILIEKIIINKKNNEIKEVKEFLKIKKDNFGKLKIELLFSSIFPKSFEDALCEENMIINKNITSNSEPQQSLMFKSATQNVDINIDDVKKFIQNYITSLNNYAQNNYPISERLIIEKEYFLNEGEGNVVLDFPTIQTRENEMIRDYLTGMKNNSIILEYDLENIGVTKCSLKEDLFYGVRINKIIVNKKTNKILSTKEIISIYINEEQEIKINFIVSSIFPNTFNATICQPVNNTPSIELKLITESITDIQPNSANINVRIELNGSTELEADNENKNYTKGIVISKNPNTNIDLWSILYYGQSLKNFIYKLNNLTPNTTYFIRAYVKNGSNMIYGNQQSFTTLAEKNLKIPTLSTRFDSSEKTNEAISGGNIISDGGDEIYSKGILWTTNIKSNIALWTETNEGGNSKSFSSVLTNLTPNTTYYARAFATNSIGTGYGNMISFIKRENKKEEFSYMKIGYQTWMNKNLAIDRFKNGDIIPMAKTAEEWQIAAERKQPAWCYYNDDVTNGEIYGKLYNWYAVNDLRGICPEGWHIASDNEWMLLTNYLGGINTAGGKLKATKTNYWQVPNVGATNISSFSALPGGYRDFDGGFYLRGYQGFFWSHTKNNSEYAWGRTIFNNNAGVNRYYYEMSLGASIRCLKD